MAPGAWDEQAIRGQLERIVASPGFSRNERLSRFLRFVVEGSLNGRAAELKESLIAVEVFGRRPDYNPKQDAIVRTEAGRLRGRLTEYYLHQGAGDPIVIEVPKGGYVPNYRQSAVLPAEPGPTQPGFPWVRVATVGAILALAAIAWWIVRGNTPTSIAVLPFENSSHDPADDYLADGLTEELIRHLSAFDGLAPRSRTSSFALKGKSGNIRDVGRELAADYLVEGTVLRAGGRLRISAQLVRSHDDLLLWSGKFDRDAADVIGAEDEISRTIVANLPIKLGRGRNHPQVNPEAYDLYLRARALGLQDSPPVFEQAIAKDPSFALAYAGLASALAYKTSTGATDVRLDLRELRASVAKALELDPSLPEASAALGMVHARDGQWAEAERSFRRAIALNPNRSESYGDFSVYVLMQEGRIAEALDLMRIAQKADPLSPEVRSQLAYVLLSSHRYQEAEAECRKLPEDCHCWPAPREPVLYECLGRALIGQNKLREGIGVLADAVAKGVSMGAPIRGYLAFGYGLSGDHSAAGKIAADDWRNPYHQALAYIGMGDRDRAIDALARMAYLGPVRVGLALSVPEFDSIRSDQRVQAIRKEVGLPPTTGGR